MLEIFLESYFTLLQGYFKFYLIRKKTYILVICVRFASNIYHQLKDDCEILNLYILVAN